jgi:hypothetical protein
MLKKKVLVEELLVTFIKFINCEKDYASKKRKKRN